MGAAAPLARFEGDAPSAGNELPFVVYAECYCGQTEAFPASIGLPAGWQELDAQRALCPDCRRAEQLELIPAEAAKGGHHGCRLFHSLVGANSVVLRIHAGAQPVDAASDRPVHFLARAEDVRELIVSLEAVVASLEKENVQ